jgi:branched-chain amino acid aminotransferase
MEQIVEKYFIEGDKLMPVYSFGNFQNLTGIIVYEVLRVISGFPLFIGEHLERLQQSVSRIGINKEIDLATLKKAVLKLIVENRIQVGNIKIVLHFDKKRIDTLAYFIPHRYPTEEEYTKGVAVGILHAERSNPEAKTIQPVVRELANNRIGIKKTYEVLLVDSSGNIREGSRSNVFFIQGDQVLTPPAETVLNGITRQKVVDILSSGRYNFVEKPVPFVDLKMFDGLFLTGTSPKVLPISRVENMSFVPGNQICHTIANEYDGLIEKYLKENK